MNRERSEQIGIDRLMRASNADAHALTILRARRYLAEFPSRGYAWYLLGFALIEMARYDEAEAALEHAVELCPAEKLWLPYLRLGDVSKFSGHYDHAASWYRKAIEAFPNQRSAYVDLGTLLVKQGRLKEAEQVLRMATHCDAGADLDTAYNGLGFAFLAQEKFEDAAACYREALRHNPKSRTAKRGLRDVTACLKELERA